MKITGATWRWSSVGLLALGATAWWLTHAYLTGAAGQVVVVGTVIAVLMLGVYLFLSQWMERRRTRQELVFQRGLMNALMDSLSDQIYFKDRASRFLRINAAMARRFRLNNPADAIGKTDFDFFAREHAEQAFRDEQRILQTGEPLVAVEEKETWPDGSVTWVSTTKQALRDEGGSILGTFGISRDITSRKQAEEALRNSEALYQSLVETLPVNILRKDNDGHILFANRLYCQTMKRALPELVGKTDFDLFPHDLAAKYVHDDQRVRATRATFEDVERHQTPDGRQVYMQVIKAPLYDAGGAVSGIQVLFWDVTARHQAEEALARTAAELKRSNAELEQFAYVASHDLQEPLRMVASYTQLLARRYRDRLDADADQFIHFAVDGAMRMQSLINDLLNYSRLGRHGQSLQPTRTEGVLRDALQNLKLAIAECGARITHDPLPVVQGDRAQLVQLLQNLIGNAIKFRRQETPAIHVTSEPCDEPALMSPEGQPLPVRCWRFAVRDNGLGIEPQYFDRIFAVFQRLHTRDQYPGSGIGLALCKKIVERHGGRIWLESTPGKGSTFYFTLPYTNAPQT